MLFRRPYTHLLGRLLQHLARAVIHPQAAIGAHRERMQYPHRSNLANSSSSGCSTSIVTLCDEPPAAEEERLPTAIATYSVIATSTVIATSSAIATWTVGELGCLSRAQPVKPMLHYRVVL